MEIKNGKLQGELLLAFISDEELYYRDRVSNELNQKIVDHQNQLNSHANVINELNKEHSKLVSVVNDLSKQVSTLLRENSACKTRIIHLEAENSRLNGVTVSLRNDISRLESKYRYNG